MPRSTLLYTTRTSSDSDATAKALANDDNDDPIQVPDAFGFALLSTPIQEGTVDLVWMFLNRTEAKQSVEWESTHPFDVVIRFKDGELHLNDYMQPAGPPPPATEILAGTESYRVMHFDPSNKAEWPNLEFSFDPELAPYFIHVRLQSRTHHLEATAELKFADATGK